LRLGCAHADLTRSNWLPRIADPKSWVSDLRTPRDLKTESAGNIICTAFSFPRALPLSYAPSLVGVAGIGPAPLGSCRSNRTTHRCETLRDRKAVTCIGRRRLRLPFGPSHAASSRARRRDYVLVAGARFALAFRGYGPLVLTCATTPHQNRGSVLCRADPITLFREHARYSRPIRSYSLAGPSASGSKPTARSVLFSNDCLALT
jgi:hypothetical protein